MIKAGEVKALNCIEKHNWCGIIYNALSKYETVKQRCLILIENLFHQRNRSFCYVQFNSGPVSTYAT